MPMPDFRMPDAAAMERLLDAHADDRAGAALRLAWRAGLTREELAALRWDQVDEDGALLRLGGREIPLDEDTLRCLRAWRARGGGVRVLGVAPQSVSRLARQALDEAGQTRVRLLDLRLDCTRRLLETHEWPYVLRVTGFSLATYRAALAPLFAPRGDAAPPDAPAATDREVRVWKIMQAERGTNAGLALWLARAGLTAREIAALTWDAVDLGAQTLRTAAGMSALAQTAAAVLAAEKARRAAGDDPHVLLTARTRRPMDAARVTALARDALIRGGAEDVTLSLLRRSARREQERRSILDLARANGSLTRADVSALLRLSAAAARARLVELARSGELVRVNARWYLPGTVTPPERQEDAVRDYIARSGAVYRQDVAQLLHVSPRSAAQLLRRMVESGVLRRTENGKQYVLVG